MKSVLISGSSITGPTLAYWLAHFGFKPTLLERNPAPRPGGHAIDIRGAGIRVIRAMGLFDAVYDLRTKMKGFSILDGEGQEITRTEKASLSGGRLDNDDIEILRDDLSALLLGKVGSGAELIYGDSMTGMQEDQDGVTVTFEKGPPRRFDLVVGADGLHSNTRDLVFGDELQFIHPLGIGLAVYSAPNHIDLKDWQITHSEEDRTYIIYPARNNTELRVCFTFPATLDEVKRGDHRGKLAFIAERFQDFDWEIPKLVKAMWNAPDFYLGLAAQIHMPRWTKGRAALVGDCGYSPSPFTGQGTSLAIVGAYVLAYELAQQRDDYTAAFAQYDAKMRPFVEANQGMAKMVMSGDYSGSEEHQERVLRALDEAKNAIALDGIP